MNNLPEELATDVSIPTEPRYFFSYNTLDYDWVQLAQNALAQRGIRAFVDREDLPKGLPWQSALESVLLEVNAVAVFVGPNGFGRWQMREVWLALEIQARRQDAVMLPVIPVMLPGSDHTPMFLLLNTWVEVRRKSVDDVAWEALASAVKRGLSLNANPAREAICPYRGLSAFREVDAPFFFGRTELSARIAQRADNAALLAIVGPSGSGKSSLVGAGVIPILRRQRSPYTSWEVITFTPGDRPFHRLAAAMVSLTCGSTSDTDRLTEAKKLGDALVKGDVLVEDYAEQVLSQMRDIDRLLIVADQFEELFTMNSRVAESFSELALGHMSPASSLHSAFAECLIQASQSKHITLLITLRSDYYGHAITLSRAFSDSIESGLINIGQMTAEELSDLITKPAHLAGLTFEGDLAGELLEDVISEPGNLPLLEFALSELWGHRDGTELTRHAYKAIGRVEGALAKRATSVFEQLSDVEKRLARDILTRLVRLGSSDEGTEDSRQRARVSDFATQSQGVLKKLADARLIITSRDSVSGEEIVEVVHEALVRRWDQVRIWLNEDREFLLWRQRLRADLLQYELAREDRGALLRGAVLTEAASWQARYKTRLNETENRIIERSLRVSSFNRWSVRAAAIVLVVAALSAIWWLNQQLQQETRLSDLQRLQLLEASADKLWPADSAHVTDLEVWLQSAEELAPKLARYRDDLARTQAEETPRLLALKEQQQEIQKSLSLKSQPSLPTKDKDLHEKLRNITESILPFQRKLEVLNDLVSGLTRLLNPDPKVGLMANVKERLAFAKTIRTVSIVNERMAWQDAIASIANPSVCPKYHGLRISAQEGLIPLQRDQTSGLWEFWDVQTGSRPRVDSRGSIRPDADSGLVFVLIPPGTFAMGARRPTGKSLEPNDDPWADTDEVDERGGPVTITIGRPFFISKFEMTQGQFLRFSYTNPSYYQPLKGNSNVTYLNPVEQVTWYEAMAVMTKLGLDLPTEAQWEYAARAGTTSVWWSGNTVASIAGKANIADTRYHSAGQPGTSEALLNDGYEIHAPVGSFLPNGFGLYDTIGNVWEWCKDTYKPYGIAAPTKQVDPSEHIIRGGGWGSSAAFSRSATRDHFKPEFRYYALGFRPARQVNE